MEPELGELQSSPAFDPPPAAVVLDGTSEPPSLGGKGAALDRLIRHGFPVPTTGVVPVAVYRRFATQAGVAACIRRILDGQELTAAEVDAAFQAAAFDETTAAAIAGTARRVGGGRRLAVRSSATVEDLARMSFAGQYRSLLGVDPDEPDDVLAAVKAVFASLWHPAPCAYRRAFGIDESSVAMAVVLMRMVPAEHAGVTFTVDPGGAAGAARVETVAGLGESLVSGQETPDAAVLPRVGPRDGADAITSRALDLSLEIEAREGAPQDVEWAWDGEQVWIVQARPITVAGDDRGDGFDDDNATIEQLDLTTAGIGEMLPGVLSPLVWELSSFMVEEAFRRLLDDLGVLPDHLAAPRGLVRRVRGRAAMDFSLMREMAASLPGSAGDSLETEYFGSRRHGRSAAARRPGPDVRLRSVVHDLRVLRTRRRAATESAAMVHTIDAVVRDAPEPSMLDSGALVAFHTRLVDLATRTMAVEVTIAADAVMTHRRLQVVVARHLGDEAAGCEAARLVARIGITADIPATASAAVYAGPTWEELGRTPPPSRDVPRSPEREQATIEDFLAELAEAAGWSEDSILTALRRRLIRRLAHESTVRLGQREQTKASLLILGGLTRRVHLEIGRRLAASGHLTVAEDVELLSPAELRESLIGRQPVPPEQLAQRRRWLARYRQDGPLPPRFTGRPEAVEVAELEGDRLEGWAASSGRFRGRVTVLHSPDGVLGPDAVLVAEATDPSWSPLFMKAGAIVLDRGGPLSHAAILARELGVPAVLNVPGATTLLEGREVTVDGDAGVVVVHDQSPGEPE